jgi:hypothetical protein
MSDRKPRPEKPIPTIPLDVARGKKPLVALSVLEWPAVEAEIEKMEGAIAVLLHMVDGLAEPGSDALGYIALQLKDHLAGLKRALDRGHDKPFFYPDRSDD